MTRRSHMNKFLTTLSTSSAVVLLVAVVGAGAKWN